MSDLAFEIAEYERDRKTTLDQLAIARIGFPGHAVYVDKYTAQLERIDARLAELRALEQCAAEGHSWQDTGAEGVETHLTSTQITKERWAERQCTRCLVTGRRSTKSARSRYGLTDTGAEL